MSLTVQKWVLGVGVSPAPETPEAVKAEVRGINDGIESLDARLADIDADVRSMLLTIPNIPDASVPVGEDESGNVEVRRWGTPPAFAYEPRQHFDIGEWLGLMDFEGAAKLSVKAFIWAAESCGLVLRRSAMAMAFWP